MSAAKKAKCVLEGEVKGVLTFDDVSELATRACTWYVGPVVHSSAVVRARERLIKPCSGTYRVRVCNKHGYVYN